MTLDMGSATVTMTQAQLVEYTERVVREATQKKESKREAMLTALLPVYKALNAAFDELAYDGHSYLWKHTDAEKAKIQRYRELRNTPSNGVVAAREKIAAARSAIRAHEKAQARFWKSWELDKEKERRNIEKDTLAWKKHCDAHHRKAKKSGNCMDKEECPSMQIKLWARRWVLDAPPLTKEQGRTLRGLLFG